MMKHRIKNNLYIALIALLALTGCISRDQADQKLAMGCAAGVELFLTEGFKIGEIKEKVFALSADEGTGYRDVTLRYVETDGWASVAKEARCTFAEEFGPLGATYAANIYQVSVNNQIYGKKGNEILGGYDQILKLTETVDRAMNNF